MDRIILPVDPHVRGRKVAALHDALAALGLAVEAPEVGTRQFGASTRAAVLAFQRAQGLTPTGVVDDATARRLTERVVAVPAVDTPAARGLLGVRGTARQTSADALARAVAGNAPGALPPERLVRDLLRARGHDVFTAPPPGDSPRFVVAGAVDHRRLDEIEVMVIRDALDAPRPEVLGRAKPNADGEFTIAFDADTPPIVRVAIHAGRRRLYVSPPGRAERGMWIEWSESAKPVPGPGAFALREALLAAALRAAGGKRLEELQESGERTDVSLLAETAGVSRTLVAAHAAAARVAAELKVDRDVIFALLTRVADDPATPLPSAAAPGQPPPIVPPDRIVEHARRRMAAGEFGELGLELARTIVLAADAAGVRDAVAQAVAQGQLSARAERRLDLNVKALEEARVGAALAAKPGASTWKEVLAAAGLGDADTARVAPLLLQHPAGDTLWQAIGDRLARGGAPAVEALRLGGLVDFDAAAMGALRAAGVRGGRDLARRPPADLERLLQDAFAHDADPAGRRDRVTARLDREFPGDSLLRRRRSRLDARTVRFLETGPGRTDLLRMNIDRLFIERSLAAAPADARAVRADLLPLQRLARVARDAGSASALADRGFGSAASIAFTDRDAFVEGARGAASDAELLRVHRRARAHYRATVALFLKHNARVNGPLLPIVESSTQMVASSAAALTAGAMAPSWEFLFGSADYCECEHCASVTSPAAYLVDLLLWLERAPGPAPKPFDVLTARRKDLVKILLNCANTMTVVPYIDLVCELLEEMAAIRAAGLGHPGAPALTSAALDQWRRDRQTRLTAELIRAYPEHLFEPIYTVLSQFTDGFVQPFDLAAAEIRAYLAHLGLDRLELMRLFGQGTDVERACERFHILPGERPIITQPAANAAAQSAQWGFTGPDVPLEQYLRRAPDPRRPKAHLRHDDLRRLLACDFPHPQRTDAAQAVREVLEPGVTVDHCRATDRRLERLTLDTLDRQHRFLRLLRHLPWSMAEVDLLLSAVAGGQLQAAALPQLARVAAALPRTELLTVEELASFYRDFDAAAAAPGARFDGRPTLYAQTFLSSTDGGTPPAAYSDPGANVAALTAERPRLLGALKLSEADFEEIRARTGLQGANVTFANLSTLYRHARLARAARLSVGDFEILRAQAVDPFGSPAQLLEFLDARDIVQRAGLTGEALAVLSGAAAATVPAVAPLQQACDALFQATAGRLAADTGAPPTAAQVLQAIVAEESWLPLVTTWLGRDSRFGILAAALDGAAAAAPGTLVADLFANPPVAATTGIFARLGVLIEALRIRPDEASPLAAMRPVLTAIRQPGWATLEPALGFVELLRSAASPAALADYLTGVGDNTVAAPALAARLAAALDLDAAWIQRAWDDLFGAGVLDRTALGRPSHYAALRRLLAIGTKLGVSTAVLRTWAGAWPSPAHAAQVRGAVRSTLSTADWLTTSRAIQDRLREQRRDALVHYLLASAQPGDPITSAQLSDHLLIDVEMDDCMDTSRIVQANAAVQLFVQRCLRGLEPIALGQIGADHWRQWQWRQRYRLWEANRMVYLYPENFLDVGRRSSASPLFTDFMKEVRQSDGSAESVRDALDGYLAGLEAIANLDYGAVGSNLAGDEGMTKELHVIGRSRGTPQKHYHRKLSGGLWTPWEELSIGTPGRHLALSHAAGTTTLMWPTFADHPDPRQTIPAAEEAPESEAPPASGVAYLSYAWTTRDRRKWTAVETSGRALLHRQRARRPFTTLLSRPGPGVNLFVYAPNAPTTAAKPGTIPATVPLLGTLQLQRDIVAVAVNDHRRGLDDWLGGDHQPHLDTTRLFEPVVCDFAGCKCYLWYDSSLQPWPSLGMDDNRQVSGLATTRLEVPFDSANPLQPQNAVVFNASSFAIAPDLVHRRALMGGASSWQAPSLTNAVAFVTTEMFRPDVFAFTDGERSLLCLSGAAMAGFAPTVPATAQQLTVLAAYHPFASGLRSLVRRYADGFERLYTPVTQETPAVLGRAPLVFTTAYGDYTPRVRFFTAAESIDFDPPAPYALYNWELFFHAPLFVAEYLRKNQRHDEAERFYHFIFTPFPSEPEDPLRPRARYWVTKPFRAALGYDTDIRDILTDGAVSGVNPYRDIEDHPFDAQRVAASRPSAHQKHVVMRYLDNLLARGDAFYRRGQREDLYEAISYYETARLILGPTPETLHPLGTRRDRAFEDEAWGGGANALVDLENLIDDAGEEPEDAGEVPLVELPLVEGLYFCVPANPRLLKYYEDFDRRLYNARHCLTIDGQPATYSLLAAPIEPQALVDAAAAGVSVGAALAMAAAQLPPYRFRVIWTKAQDACNEVKALGGGLLAALEKRDAEQMAALRSTWEGRILERTRSTRETQRDQSAADVDALVQQKATIAARRQYYLTREFMIELERAALGLSVAAAALDTVGFVFDVLGGVLYLIPNVNLGVSGFGGTPQAGANIGGQHIGESVAKSGQGLSRLAGLLDRAGGMVSTQAGYARRQEEWTFQAEQAGLDLAQIDRQIAAARLRVAIGEAELRGHAAQEQSWAATDAMLSEKFTNEERYDWLIEVLRELYQQAYQHAVKLARLARECLAYELPAAAGVPAIGQQHWTGVSHGLLAGERLAADLRALDVLQATTATHTEEVTRHIALSHVAPAALIALRRTGGCSFRIPRWWLQRVDPTFRNRRIKSVSVSVPSVTGPYVAMNATLSLQGSHRTRASITLSTGVNDFGVDVAAAAEKYLPFEGVSLESETLWSFGFPPDPANPGRVLTDVDVSTISDVILHLQLTATVDSPLVDGPPDLLAFVDLRSMAADNWTELVTSPAHATTVSVSRLVPRFLSGYSIDAVTDRVALLRDGTEVTSKLAIAPVAGAAPTEVAISLRPGETVDWGALSRVYVVAKMKR